MAEVLREPLFPGPEFERFKQERLAGLEQIMKEPQSIASSAMTRYLNPYPKDDVRYVPTFDEMIADLKALTLDDVRKFYAAFYGASKGEVSVVGDFDDKEIPQMITELFGGWKSAQPYRRIASTFHDIPSLSRTIETPDKANAFFIACLPLKLTQDDPEYPALELANYMLGGGFLNSRFAMRIRQKEGISYGIGSALSISPWDKVGILTTTAIYAPENAARLEEAFKQEIARVLEEGFSADEVAAAKSGYLQSKQVARAQDRSLVNQLAVYLLLNRTLRWDENFERRIATVTPQEVNDALRRHLDPSKITIIKAGDFAKAAGK